MKSRKYVTISVPVEVKETLEKAKGDEEWGKFLLNLYIEANRMRSEKAFKELTEILTEEDLKSIIESSREFREVFTLR
mgnify:CR=1 FL=1